MKTDGNDLAFGESGYTLTKREHFALEVLRALKESNFVDYQSMVNRAVKIADALIVALNKGKDEQD